MKLESAARLDEHEQIVLCQDPESGLEALIAVHDTTRGPAVGGCRMWPYASQSQALDDVLRLSRSMSHKSAMADLRLGGGKAVIIGDPRVDKCEALLRAFGRFVNELGGRYLVGEDVGISVDDVDLIGKETRYVVGRSRASGSSGDPSPMTARGVFVGMRAALAHRSGSDSLEGVRVAVQGLGHVGGQLCRLLARAGAELCVADLHSERAACVAAELGARQVDADEILFQPVDVLAPCALGAVLNDDTIPRLRAGIVAGAANNQLAEARHGDQLHERGILFAPDFVINAGGIINIASELCGRYDQRRSEQQIDAIGPRLLDLLDRSERTGTPIHRIAETAAREKLSS
jgi:leucine dehydrogenase